MYFKFRLNHEEKLSFDLMFLSSNYKNKSEFVRDSIFKKVIVNKKSEYDKIENDKEMMYAIGKIGNNINQITKIMNSKRIKGTIDNKHIDSVDEKLANITEQLNSIYETL